MISVLIPVFNVDVYPLVQELSNQLKSLDVKTELLIYDDGSDGSYKNANRSVASLENVYYKELDKNYGRVAIRQKLAENAVYDWLLFIDSDSAIIDKSYLDNYFQSIAMGFDVYAGGTKYYEDPPVTCSKRLHWKYGKERESVKGNSKRFHTNNFLIRKELFQHLKFPQQLSGYGHEDTWMEMELERQGKKIAFIQNPVLHTGLEDASVYLEKSKNALKNLLVLVNLFGEAAVRKQVRLYNWFYWQRKFQLQGIIKNYLQKRIKKTETDLQSCHPSLRQFDLFRLYYLLFLAKK